MIPAMQETLTAAEALRLYRERAGLSQFEAARKLGITRANQLSLIETGKEVPDAKLAKRIERVFRVPSSLWPQRSAA